MTLSGSGVTLFFTHVSGKSNSHGYGQVVFDGDSQINLTAPSVTSGGALSTMLFFTDRNWVHTAAQDFQLNDAEYHGNGVWYITGTGVQLTAKSSTPFTSVYISLVTDSVFIDSSTLNLFSDFSSVSTGVNTGVLSTANPFRVKAVLIQ